MLKKQVFELLSALCVYSEMGYKMAIDALVYFKVTLYNVHVTRFCKQIAVQFFYFLCYVVYFIYLPVKNINKLQSGVTYELRGIKI